MADLETTYRLIFGKDLDFGLPTPKPDLSELADLLMQQGSNKPDESHEAKAYNRQAVIKAVTPHLDNGVSIEGIFNNSGRNGFNQCRIGNNGWDLVKVFKYLELNGHLNAETMAMFAEKAIQKAAGA